LIVFKGGAAGQVPTSFLPTHGASGFGGLGEAFVFIVLAFFGFESCSTVAEECRNPRRNLPRALVGSVVLTGLWFSFAMYAIIVGYGSKNVGLISKAVSPLHDLAVQYIGSWYGTVIDLAAVSAMIAVLLAIHTANFRIIYSLGRDGMLPKSLGRTHPKWKTPHIAIIVFSIFSLIVATIAGAAWGPVGAFGDLGYLSSLGILPIYIGANVALPYFMKRHFKSEFSFFLHVILPAISSLIFLVAIYLSLHPWPASPETFFPWILLLWILGAIAWAVYLKKKDSSMLTRLGMVMFMVPESGFAEPDMLEIVVSAGDEVGHS
jgi:amino acid transporter